MTFIFRKKTVAAAERLCYNMQIVEKSDHGKMV